MRDVRRPGDRPLSDGKEDSGEPDTSTWENAGHLSLASTSKDRFFGLSAEVEEVGGGVSGIAGVRLRF